MDYKPEGECCVKWDKMMQIEQAFLSNWYSIKSILLYWVTVLGISRDFLKIVKGFLKKYFKTVNLQKFILLKLKKAEMRFR